MSRGRRRTTDPDQFDLFEPPHEQCEDGRGAYLQFLIAPPTELAGATVGVHSELSDAARERGPARQ